MRHLFAITVGLLAAYIAVADDTEVIEWSSARSLVWSDFVGSVPAGTNENRVAETSASISWSYEYSIEWSGDTCAFSILVISAAARFHPDSSWVRAGHRTDAVLQHEQGHFDIAQLHKTQFVTETREFLGVTRSCSGRNERRATRSAESEIARLVSSVYDNIWRQYRDQQEIYDLETSHGIDASSQAEWTENIDALLKAATLP